MGSLLTLSYKNKGSRPNVQMGTGYCRSSGGSVNLIIFTAGVVDFPLSSLDG